MPNLRLFFAIILIMFGLSKCTTETPIPEVYINFTLHLSNPLYDALNSVGNSVYIPNEGYKGLIITRTDIDKFEVYDASCTYDTNDNKALIEIKEISGVCRSCKSKFNLMLLGYVEEGPATVPLKTYNARFNVSAQTLYVYN